MQNKRVKKNQNQKKNMAGDPFVIASSALFFLPAIVSFFRQSMLVALIFFNAALFATLYHAHEEAEFLEFDMIWANLAILVSLMMLAVVARKYPLWNWRILVPLVSGLVGFGIYFGQGSSEVDPTETEKSNYHLYHGIWHVCVAVAGFTISLTPVNLADIQYSYYDTLGTLFKKTEELPVTEKTLLI